MYYDFACFTAITHFVANYVKFCNNVTLEGVFLINYSITYLGGGQANSLQYYMGMGSSETPNCIT